MALEDAKQFLARVIAWPQDGDPPAFINIHNTFLPPDGRRTGQKSLPWAGRAVRTLADAVNAVDYALSKPGTRDIYVCMSTQRDAELKVGKNDWKYYKPIRMQQNVVALKSLYLDIDFKGGLHGYDSQEEAVGELARFLKETKLPKPSVIVMSGGGVHCYWTMSRALTLGEWAPLAYALAEATKAHALKCDTQVTVDGARVLRIPQTFNRKLDTPRAVSLASDQGLDYSVEYLAGILEPYKTQVPAGAPQTSLLLPVDFVAPSASVLAKFQVANDLSAGLEREYPKPNLDEVAPECSFLGHALSTGGKDYPQPMWNLTTLLSTFTEGGRADAHRMSNQHPGYTKESTDEFFDRKDRERTEKGLGWPSCASISSTGCTACQSCKHFTKGRTPFHTVLQVAAAIGVGALGVGAATPGPVTAAVHPSIAGVVPNDLPENYHRGADGIVKVTIRDKDDPSKSEYVPIAAYSMEEPWLQLNPDILNFTSRIEQGKPKPVHIELACVGTAEMRKILQGQGFMLPHGDRATTRIAEFMNSWIKNLRDTRASVQSAPFGWNDRGSTIDGFVYGGNVWRPTGSTAAAASEPELRRQYDPIGELEPWVKATKMITDQQRPALEVIIASSFGAPLVMFTGEPGVILSAFSKESGIGKSTAMKVALAVWGDPYSAMLSLDDTKNYAMGKLGRLRHLPMFWDEIKSEAQTRKLVDITFEVTGAKEKGRMSRDASLREPGQWRTLFVAASNESLLDPVMKHTPTTTAGLYRVFEFVVPPGTIGQIVPSDAALMVADLARNHGAVGLAYAKFLGENQVAIADQMKLLLEQLYAETNSKGEERFWVVAIASVILGARYANHLGVAALDEVGIKKFLLSSLGQMRTHMTEQPVDLTKEVNLSNIMAGYLSAARQKHILFTNKLHVGRGKPTAGSIIVESSMCDSSKMDGVWVHYGMTDGLVRFAHAPLKHWLSEMGYAPSIVTTGMMQEYKAHRTQGNIGAGTKFKGGTEYLYELDLINAPNLDIR